LSTHFYHSDPCRRKDRFRGATDARSADVVGKLSALCEAFHKAELESLCAQLPLPALRGQSRRWEGWGSMSVMGGLLTVTESSS